MRATIGLLTYNHQNSIHRDIFVRSLECLVNQDYKNKELVICDDHSTDGTYEICQKYAERYSFIKLFRNDQNLGAMMNFDKLLTNISGDIFLWACPDDCYAVNYVTACVNTFVKSNKTIMVTSAVKVLNDNGDIYHWYYHDFARNLPFRKLVRNILKCRDTMGFYIEYQSIIHASMVRVKYIPMIYCRDAFYGFEEAWFINTLIWGKLDYINSILYYRYASFVSYEIKNPEVFINFSKRFCYLVAALNI